MDDPDAVSDLGPSDAAVSATSYQSSLLDTLGEDIIRIISPVSLCMFLVVLLVTSLSSSGDSLLSISSSLFSSSDTSLSDSNLSDSNSTWDEIKSALITSFSFVVVVTLMTFILVLLFYFRCTKFLKVYMAISSFYVLSFLGGFISLLLLSHFKIPIDPLTFSVLLINFSIVGVLAVFMSKFPIFANQGFLVTIGVLTAYWFTFLPEWTTWILLVAMSLYDLAAVLLPVGPLRLLVELSMSRDEEIPALVYEARPVNPEPGAQIRTWRRRSNAAPNPFDNSTSSTETRLVVSDEITAPLIETFPRTVDRRVEEEEEEESEGEGIGLGSSGAIKLGLGDFIFYSVLVGRAAMYDYMTVYACYLAIMAGLGVTLMLLAVYHKALPALPFSIMLGVLFYLLTRVLLEEFVVQCSSNLFMF